MAATQDGEPGERKNDGANDAYDKDGTSCAAGFAGGIMGVQVGGVRVVADGEEMALRNGCGRGELAGVQFVVGKVVVGDAEVLAERNAEGEGASGTEVVLALGDGGEGFGPGSLFGGELMCGFCIHGISSSVDEMRLMAAAAKAWFVALMLPGRLTARQRSSMTNVSKPS